MAEQASAAKIDPNDVTNDEIRRKYSESGRIVNLALTGIIKMCVPGSSVLDLCKFGDSVVHQSLENIYKEQVKGKPISKGLAFPTSLSVNHCIANNSPMESDIRAQPPIAKGDMVKIEIGCHIDGYIALAAHTITVGGNYSAESPCKGKEADVVLACYKAAVLAALSLKPNQTNSKIAEMVNEVANVYGVSVVSGTKMHQMKRFVINGSKTIVPCKEDPKAENCTFEEKEVVAVNVIISTGGFKTKAGEQTTSIYKRTVDKTYRLKMNASKNLLQQVNLKYPTVPFSIRNLDDEKHAKLGLKECISHELLEPYPVIVGNPKHLFAHFQFTVLMLPEGPSIVAGLGLDGVMYSSEMALSEETNAELKEFEDKMFYGKKGGESAKSSNEMETGA